MKKYIIVCVVSVMVSICISSVKADLIYGTFATSAYTFDANSQPLDKTRSVYWAGGIVGKNVTTMQDLQFFCGDPYTNTTRDFIELDKGQEYNTAPLAVAPGLSFDQKKSIQSLFNHVYSPLLSAQATLALITENSEEKSLAQNSVDILGAAFQFAIWEILYETSDTWDITSGSFTITNPNPNPAVDDRDFFLTPSDAYMEIVGLTNGWFTSIKTGIWADNFAGETFYRVTYFFIDETSDVTSQPFFAATGKGNTEITGIVPAPASILILGLGLGGLPFFRRKKQN